MKEKEPINVEDVLAQLHNSRTQQNALISLYNKLNGVKFSNVQRTRLLKIVAVHCLRDGNSTDLRVAALTSALPSLHSACITSSNPVSGADFYLLETCIKIVQEYLSNSSSQHIDIVSKALEIISLANAATVSKLFSGNNALSFKKLMSSCLGQKDLRFHALTLLAVGLSLPSTDGLSKAISENVVPLIQLVYPLIFNLEDQHVHSAALKVMKELKLTTKPQPFWNQLKEETQKSHCKRMVDMVNAKANWPEVWKCIVNLFGEELHSGGQLINHMLEVLERAFKHSDFVWTRVQAFECWNTLIDNFNSGLKNRKRIDLIMIPLKANNHRIETLAFAKLKTYNHLLATLGKDLVSSPDILTNFFTFCFGSEKTSCPPVKSYPALHDKCIECILGVLVSSFGEELFKKIQKELVTAVGECFLMDNGSESLLSQLWIRLLELVGHQDGTDAVKKLFIMVHNLVVRAGNKELNGSLQLPQPMSPPSKPAAQQLNEDLGRKIAVIMVHGIVESASALPRDLLKMRSLYVGSYDVMNGTPALLLMEWLLSPAVMLGAWGSANYNQSVSKILRICSEEPAGFIDFTQLVLKKLIVSWSLNSIQKTSMNSCVTQIWCTLADELSEFIRKGGSINQGDAAQHDFTGIYSVLLFPYLSLHEDMKLIELCANSWSNLFYEACQQAELVPTASLQLLFEQVCTRFLSKADSSCETDAPLYFFFTCMLEVANKKFKSKKSSKWVLLHISDILKTLKLQDPKKGVFDQAANCFLHCLKPTPTNMEVVRNVCPGVCSLLQAGTLNSESETKLCALLSALKDASMYIHQHGSSKESVNELLQNVVTAGRNHSGQEVRSVLDDLCNIFSSKISEEEEKSQLLRIKGAFSPSSRVGFSPKSASKKFATVQMSPSNLSPGGAKRKLQTTVCGSDGKFVRIETPPKKIILTEHQKEVRRERRDIPALYQDLSQDTQTMSQDSSQDCVALPATPKGKSSPVLDEDAVMDVVELNTSLHAFPAKKMMSPKSSKKNDVELDSKSVSKSFTPPVGFLLPTKAEDTKSVVNTDEQEILPGKENENLTHTPKSVKFSKVSLKGTLTRSSSNTNLTTRSGKIMKRTSIAGESVMPNTRKSRRKSLPANFSDESVKKGTVDTVVIESDTDTESVSSLEACGTGSKPGKAMLRSRRSIKREVSLESDSDASDFKNCPDKSEKVVSKTESPEKNRSSDAEDEPLAKLLGGKILTRSRSNSSLDDVTLVKKSKTSSPDSKDKVIVSVLESNSEIKESLEQSASRSPRKNSSHKKSAVSSTDSIETSPIDKNIHRTHDSPSTSPVCIGVDNRIKASEDAETRLKDFDASGPGCLDKLLRLPSQVSSSMSNKANLRKDEKQVECISHGSLSPSKSMPVTSEPISTRNNVPIEFENGTEESQEIIESSQEPMLKFLKPCLVSLEHFPCSKANEKVEFENLTIAKGPAPNSPYKILCKDDSTVEPVKQNSACRRSLLLDEDEKLSSSKCSTLKVISPPISVTADCVNKSPPIHQQKSATDSVSKKLCLNAERETKSIAKPSVLKEGTEQDLCIDGEEDPQARNNSMPEWMHGKKCSPLRTIRYPSARSQALMKSVIESSTSPPKAVDASPVSSPVQSKRFQKSSTDVNTTPIIKRSSRAAQLLGLGQAAAARGGETVVSSSSRSLRMDKTSENEETEILGTSGNSSMSSVVATSTAASVSNLALVSVSAVTTPVASPSVRRHKLHDLESPKSTQKCLEDRGNKKDWVPKGPRPTATPDSSILKRKREVDSDAPSPSVKRKRVSFRDPPLSTFLKFGETSEGTVFTSDGPKCLDKAADEVTLDHAECPASKNDEDQIEGSGPSCESLSTSETCSPREKKDTNKPSKNCLENNSPSKNSSVTLDKGCVAIVVEKESPSKSNLALFGRFSRRKASCESENSHASEEEYEKECVCDDEQVESNSELSEVETQGMLDDLHRMPSTLTPIWVNLIECTHPIGLISSRLTSPVLIKSLLRELSEAGIRTVGDLAKLTEEQLDRLPVKSPKQTNVCYVLEEFEKQHINCKLANCLQDQKNISTQTHQEAAKSLKEILFNTSNEDIMNALSEAEMKSDFCKTMLQSLPFDDVIKSFDPEDLVKGYKPEELMKFLKQEDLIKFFKAEGFLKFLNPDDVIKVFKVEDLIKFFKPEDVIKFFKAEDLVKFFKTEDLINSLNAGNVAHAVSLNSSVIKSLPVDVCAEAYISQVDKSSGSKEKEMSVQQLTSILNRVPGRTIHDTFFPSVPSLLSTVYTDIMCSYVLRECTPTEIVEKLDNNKAQECALKLLPKLDPRQVAEQIEDDRVEETIKALLSRLNQKRSLKFLLEQGLNVCNKLK